MLLQFFTRASEVSLKAVHDGYELAALAVTAQPSNNTWCCRYENVK
jgi:hypothetical protein